MGERDSNDWISSIEEEQEETTYFQRQKISFDIEIIRDKYKDVQLTKEPSNHTLISKDLHIKE